MVHPKHLRFYLLVVSEPSTTAVCLGKLPTSSQDHYLRTRQNYHAGKNDYLLNSEE